MRKGAKWTIGIVILAIVAIVLTIVFINLFKERETTELATEINEVAENGYLSSESEEYQQVQKYLQNVASYFSDGEEKYTIQNYKDSYTAFTVAIDFFNREMLFTKYTDEYKENLREIKDDFKDGQEAAEDLKDYINETKQVVGDSPFWNTNTWQTAQGYMKTIFEGSRDALTRLGIVYKASVNSSLMNNDYTTIIFDGFTNVTNQVVSDLGTNATKGNALMAYTNAYLSAANEEYILGYAYNTKLQSSVKDIKEKGAQSALYADFLLGQIDGRETV